MTDQVTTLFIYGTLKRGDARAPLLTGQRFLGVGRTKPAYRLFNTGDYPALVEAEHLGLQGLCIAGELWSVDEACLSRLDVEEGVGEGLYIRQPIAVQGERAQVQAYYYLHSVDGLDDCGASWSARRSE